jgi:DNA-directed RNA polymerase subunit RPC12/RpoP
MPIRFKCPNCQKPLAVKDQMAGKKAACPACKKALVVPQPVAALPTPELEALAAAALADAPAQKADDKPKSPQFVDFVCPFCDAELHLDAELGGKQSPCPECKRIIRVPKPKEDKPKDWREVHAGPRAALAGQPELKDAWGSTTNKAKVSREALEEAGVIVEEKEPIGVVGWAKRIGIGVGAAVFLLIATVWLTRAKQETQKKEAIDKVLDLVEGKNKLKLAQPMTAEVFRGVGEYFTLAGNAEKARTYFGKGRAQFLGQLGSGADRDLMLARLAVSLIDLGGGGAEILDEKRVSWDRVQEDLGKTIEKIQSDEGRAWAVRTAAERLGSHGQSAIGLWLANRMKANQPVLPPALQSLRIALMLEHKMDAEVHKEVPPPDLSKPLPNFVVRAGYAEGFAREGNLEEARKIVQAAGAPIEQFQAAVAVALAVKDLTPAILEMVMKAADEARDRASPWERLALAHILGRTGDVAKVKQIVESVPGEMRNWAGLELLQLQLAKTPGKAQASLLDEAVPDKASLPRFLGWEMLARHNARLGEITASDNTSVQPFIAIGEALGVVDRQR